MFIEPQVHPETQESTTSEPPSYSASDVSAIGTALSNLGNHMQLLENSHGLAIEENQPSFVVDALAALLSSYRDTISAIIAPLISSGASS